MVQEAQVNRGIKVIFVGPDCGGKSTISKLLGEMLGMEVAPNRKRSTPPSEVRRELLHDGIKMVNVPGISFIRDQWPYPVDLVYSRAMKKPSPIAHIADSLERLYMRAGVLIVYVTASPEVLQKRYEVRGDELWDLGQIQNIAREYERAYENGELGNRVIRVDTSVSSPKMLAGELFDAVTVIHDLFWRGIV